MCRQYVLLLLMKNSAKKVNGFIVYSVPVEVIGISIGRKGRNNSININIHLPFMSHFQMHEVYAKKTHGIDVTLIRAQI